MRLLLLSSLLFFPVILFGQCYTLKGRVIDLTTKEPVPNGIVRLYREADSITLKKDKLIDSTTCDVNGLFSFSALERGYYRISYKIRVDTTPKQFGDKYNFRYDSRNHILIDANDVAVELTPEIYCEYAEYRHLNHCPVCKEKKHLMQVVYGLPEYDVNDINRIKAGPGKYWIGYCTVDPLCYARWYCSKCKKIF